MSTASIAAFNTIFLILSTVLAPAHSLTCSSCLSTNCEVLIECKAGVVKDECNCCAVCAQADGDECGGPFDIYGKCGINLYCSKPHLNKDSVDVINQERGICKECEQVTFYGCNLISGICQCGSSCTVPFTYSDEQSCRNESRGLPVDCSRKRCPQGKAMECPPGSWRPPSKPSLDGCCLVTQECECRTELCQQPLECGIGYVSVISHKASGQPGDCCHQYECIEERSLQCKTVNNTILQEGSVIEISECMSCICDEGILKCTNKVCPVLNCNWMTKPPGECCPVCKSCVTSSGKLYEDGDQWVEDDSCVVCKCVGGETQCQASVCRVECENPKKIPGRCCPVCDEEDRHALQEPPSTSTNNCGEASRCPANCQITLIVAINGCDICICEDELTMCQGHSPCSKECPYGYVRNETSSCSLCQCNTCPSLSCDLTCPFGYVQDSQGCSTCQCQDEISTETIDLCYTAEGQTHRSGDVWFDGCRLCYCDSGKEMCSLLSCAPLSCDQPLLRPGDCCPSCPAVPSSGPVAVNLSLSCTTSSGAEYKEKESWQFDTCTSCICYNQQALCETERCPPTLCNNPVRVDGKCCPECVPSIAENAVKPVKTGSERPCITQSGLSYKHDDIWRVGDCQSCVCYNGVITCYSQVCPSLSCKTTIVKKGQCCPLCTADHLYDKICIHKNNKYGNLETWEDNSLQCTCYEGTVECKSTEYINNGSSVLSMTVGLPIVIVFSVLLLLFAVIIALLAVILVRQRTRRNSKLKAIPKILEQRALNNDPFTKKRPKSTNLEFLHATNDNRYNTAISKDRECCTPLVHGNEYVQC